MIEPADGPSPEWDEAKHEIEIYCGYARGMLQTELSGLARIIHNWNKAQGFWTSNNTGEKFMLIVTEIAEAMEGHRNSAMSDKIPEFTAVEEEFSDALIRMLDYAGAHSLRLGDAFIAKLEYNLTRPYKHGKSC